MVAGQVIIGREEVEAEAVNEYEMGTQRQSMSVRWGDRGSQ